MSHTLVMCMSGSNVVWLDTDMYVLNVVFVSKLGLPRRVLDQIWSRLTAKANECNVRMDVLMMPHRLCPHLNKYKMYVYAYLYTCPLPRIIKRLDWKEHILCGYGSGCEGWGDGGEGVGMV